MSARSPRRAAAAGASKRRGIEKNDDNNDDADESSPFSSPAKRTRAAARTPNRAPGTPHLVTPSSARKGKTPPSRQSRSRADEDTKPAARRLPFGRSPSNASSDGAASTASLTVVAPAVKKVYSLVSGRTGSLGGNGAGGAIYGELTSGSMQKMVDLMKLHTDFGPDSRFIDVGCGLGKPNLHVATDPGVSFSYGIEHEKVRWLLGMSNLDAVLQLAEKQQQRSARRIDKNETIGTNCMFAYADITEAQTLDPFTHVYMFDIGFPPKLFYTLAEMYNRSSSKYLICYHAPRLMVDEYGFDVELIVQTNTSMHGSTESHMGYIYKRVASKEKKGNGSAAKSIAGLPKDVPCDPLFAGPWKMVRKGFRELRTEVKKQFQENQDSDRPKRTRRAARK
mmetsp:Transcript_37509/g.82121  ORF Transcript_37509/g.82121 Transcript_37509/m.82121 type:complete len:394 (+) Transcript_37509:116-1297(+)